MIRLHDYIKFEGNLKANNLLENAEYIGHKEIRGPECIAVSNDGYLYTGLMNGQIIRIDPKTNLFEKVVLIGKEDKENYCSKKLSF